MTRDDIALLVAALRRIAEDYADEYGHGHADDPDFDVAWCLDHYPDQLAAFERAVAFLESTD